MADITAQMVKEIRDRTGAPFIDCKKALEEVAGDFDKAIEILKIKGVAKAAKKVGRETPEGTIASYIHAGGDRRTRRNKLRNRFRREER
jgi:elongation factor Ts